MSLVVKELNARDIENYRDRAQAISDSTLREYYELEMDRCKGYSKEGVEGEEVYCHDPDFARISLAHQMAYIIILFFKNNLYFAVNQLANSPIN